MAKTKQRHKKKPLISKNAFLGLFIIIIMVGSGIGLMLGQSPIQGDNYKDYQFKKVGDFWITSVEGQNYQFRYLPETVENINLSKSAINAISQNPAFYLTFDPLDENIQTIESIRFEMERDFDEDFGKFVAVGVTNNVSSYSGFPVVTCNNASVNAPVVYIKTTNKFGFDFNNNCLTLNFGYPAEAYMLKDRLLYSLIGIIN